MPHVNTSLCLRDNSCREVCPTDSIHLGEMDAGWPWMYINPETCIDCGACVTECPYGAIFPEDEVPANYRAKAGQQLNAPRTENLRQRAVECYVGVNSLGQAVTLENTVTLAEGESVDLTPDIQANAEYYTSGPGRLA